ncbi:MAG TPA: GAF and ANTAR domain-containing protein [Acidimicrobiales bacterium]|nr:GAF and ANTAR domain-containing protein [Acidimicrobiales bacterium]
MAEGERRLRILGRFVGDGTVDLGTKRLCQLCADVTDLSGAGIMLMSGDLPRGSLCTTNAVSAIIEQLQYDLGEGPCVDAFRQDRPVLEPNLAHPRTPRWLAFAPPAVEAGVQAVFGFPLQIGAVRLGALNLYRDQPGRLSDEQHADSLVLANIAANTILMLQADAPPGMLAAELEAGADFQYVVHQASGMVAAQLGVSVAHAIVRLRAYAFANNRFVAEVAEDVVARMLRFDADDSAQDAAS